jgi:glucosamine--fructose-6-phosphate aminotransferase (isomerizing)
MCGIVGYLGVYCAVNYLFNGILALQNRGYDSVGMTTMRKHKLITSKFANTDCIQATELLKSNLSNHYDSNIGIAHCRWATHGAKTDINAHPHHDYTNTLSLVHNGIIDNHNELRQDLISNYNVKFQSQTDSEVIVNLISIYYKLTNDMSTAIKLTIDKLIGTWAVVLINSLEPDKLYCSEHTII